MTKSIMATALLAMLATPVSAQERAAMGKYQAMTRVEPRCSAPKAGNEIIVCGRRRADRWRVPFILKEPGDRSIQNVSAERNGLIATTTPCQDNSVFLIGCGSVGISATVGFAAGQGVKLRPLAD
jgi:hypothetical protein